MAIDELKARSPLPWYTAAVVAVTAGLFVAACCLPATDIGRISDTELPAPGWVHLVFGAMPFIPAWYANPALAAGSVQLLRRRFLSATLWGAAATLLGLTTLVSYKLETKYIGYYLWQASQMVFAVGAAGAYLWSLLSTQRTSRV